MDSNQRISALRAIMLEHNLDVYVVPSADEHASEYVAACAKRRAFLSGFTGSAGTAIVLSERARAVAPHGCGALVWTDGRYYLQAEAELQGEWRLMRSHAEPTPEQWVADTLPEGTRVGACAQVLSVDARNRWLGWLGNKATLVLADEHLVDSVWGAARPAPPAAPVRLLPLELTGLSYVEKHRALCQSLASAAWLKTAPGWVRERASLRLGTVVCALDEVAWLLNIRGADVECNPVLHAYAIVTCDATALFIDAAARPDFDAVASALGACGVSVHAYGEVAAAARRLAASGVVLTVDARTCNMAVYGAVCAGIDGDASLDEGQAKALKALVARAETSPLCAAKAIKNATELVGMRACHVRDGAALVGFLAWLDEQAAAGTLERWDEVSAGDELEARRRRDPHFVSLSFETISSMGANGAVIHYTPRRGACAALHSNGVYLCDSGAQYLDGTTDVTRVVRFGAPTAHEMRCYTRVLQGHIALDRAVFVEGTTGYQLDLLARLALWRDGLDYQHGTGHGVGAFLNVHEGPHLIGSRMAPNDPPLLAGMTVTNEPGYYEAEAQFGMRIENVMLVVEADTPHRFADKRYLRFEHITWAPLCRKLIDVSLLGADERAWVDEYHAHCLEKLLPLLEPAECVWLREACRPL